MDGWTDGFGVFSVDTASPSDAFRRGKYVANAVGQLSVVTGGGCSRSTLSSIADEPDAMPDAE